MAVVLTENVRRWPHKMMVPISFPFSADLSGRTITFYGIRASNPADTTDISGGILGLVADSTYNVGLDMAALTKNKLYRLVGYTDDDVNGNNVQVCPNPLTDDPYYFIPEDKGGM